MNGPHEGDRPIQVLIVEDHPVVAEGLRALLGSYADLTVTGTAISVEGAAAALEDACPDVAVVDFHLPDGTGADVADHIRARCSTTAIVFLTGDDCDERLLEAIEAGASGYLLKSVSGAEIVESIRAAAVGETLIPAGTIATALAERRRVASERSRQTELLASLTEREREILALMVDGTDNRAIAESLHISYATVRTHVRSILAKLDAHSQLDAVAKAAQMGFHR
jgi:two-component system, NarL family, response regulator DevR